MVGISETILIKRIDTKEDLLSIVRKQKLIHIQLLEYK